MSVLAVSSLLTGVATLGQHVRDVVRLRPEEQVTFGVAVCRVCLRAWWVVAVVKDVDTGRYWAVRQRPCDAVGQFNTSLTTT